MHITFLLLLLLAARQERYGKACGLQSAGKLKEAGAKADAITIVDITNEADASKLEQAMSSAHALVIATSGVPEMRGPPKEGQPPNFGWKGDQLPEQVHPLHHAIFGWTPHPSLLSGRKRGLVPALCPADFKFWS